MRSEKKSRMIEVMYKELTDEDEIDKNKRKTEIKRFIEEKTNDVGL